MRNIKHFLKNKYLFHFMSTILITGSSGTIGTELFRVLVDEGYNVIGVDKRPNIWYKDLNKKTVLMDLTKQSHFRKINKKDIGLVIHLAANARVYSLVKNPKLAKENVLSTFNILEFMRKNKIKKFIFASSREVYGNNENYVKEEDVDIKKCESPYTSSKISGEAFTYAYNKCYDIDFVIIRYSNVYGKYDLQDRLIPIYLSRAVKNLPLYVYGKEKALDFTYIADAITGTKKIIEKYDKVKGDVFNISSGIKTKIIDIARKIKEITGSKSEIIIKDNRPGEIMSYVGDISKARKLLSYEPKYDIDKGLKLTYEWYKEMDVL